MKIGDWGSKFFCSLFFIFCFLLSVFYISTTDIELGYCQESSQWILTELNYFEEKEEVGNFVSMLVNTYLEWSGEHRTQGTHSLKIKFFKGYSEDDKRSGIYSYYHQRGYPYKDWSKYDRFVMDVYNPQSYLIKWHLRFEDGTTTLTQIFDLIPGKWNQLKIPITSFTSAGMDTKNIIRIGCWQTFKEMRSSNTLFFDNIRLEGTNPEIRRAKEKEDSERKRKFFPDKKGVSASYLPEVVKEGYSLEEIELQEGIAGVIETQVAVIGGGLAGTAAAVAAARNGVEVTLVERYGFLGGMATAGLVYPFMSSKAGREQIIKGIFLEIIGRLRQLGGVIENKYELGIYEFDPEILKYVLNQMVEEARVKLMFHTLATEAIVKEGVIKGVVVETKAGRYVIIADIVIDATGDGDIAVSAGAPFEQGRGLDELTQAMTLMFRVGNVDMDKVMKYQNRHLRYENLHRGFSDIFKTAVKNGDFPTDMPIYNVYIDVTPLPGVVSINATQVEWVNPTKIEDLTYAEIESRKQVMALMRVLKKYIPGFSNSYLMTTATQVGIRESRRIIGEYILTGEDVLSARKFPDVIARSAFQIDIHCADGCGGGGVAGLKLEPGESFDIPYRCLVPKMIDNLLVAGRDISVTHIAYGSTRIMPVCTATGEAAGVAAALCIKTGSTPRSLDVPLLQKTLLQQGADLGR